MPAVLIGQNDVIEESKTETPEQQDHTTHKAAFMVLIDKDGNYIFEPDINKPVIPERRATPHEIKGALHVILGDIQAQESAMVAMQLQEMRVRQMMEQQQNQQMLQGLKLK